MTTNSGISQNFSTICNFSTTNISKGIESTGTLSISEDNLSHSSYRKSYIAWDKLERANKPDNYTEKTKYLSKNAKALLSVVYQKLKKQPVLLLTHKYISTITCSGSRQNQNIVRELAEILDISYHRSTEDHKGKKYEYVYKFIHKTNKKESREKNVIRKKISVSNALCTYIRKNKVIKNRSKANFEKNHFSKENSNTEINNKIGEGKSTCSNGQSITKANTYQIASDNSVSSFSKTTKKQIISNNSNGFLGSGKFLSEMLEDLTEDMCDLLRSNCGRNFTNRAIKEIAKAVSKSKKGSKAFFYHIKGFIAYLSKILRFEKRDPEKISGDNYYITSNQTEEERDIKKQEKYLSEIEYSLQISPEWHLKKKLAAVLERAKAYDIITSLKSLDIKQNKALITVNKHVELSKEDKNIILNQIRATHETMDDKGQIQYIESLEIITPDRYTAPLDSASSPIELEQEFLKREGIWGKVREKFARQEGSEGDAIDKSWTARLKAEIDENNNTIDLIAPTPFVRDWIDSNYLSKLESIAKDFGYNIDSIRA